MVVDNTAHIWDYNANFVEKVEYDEKTDTYYTKYNIKQEKINPPEIKKPIIKEIKTNKKSNKKPKQNNYELEEDEKEYFEEDKYEKYY